MTRREAYRLGKTLGLRPGFAPSLATAQTAEYGAIEAETRHPEDYDTLPQRERARRQGLWDAFFAGTAAGVKARLAAQSAGGR